MEDDHDRRCVTHFRFPCPTPVGKRSGKPIKKREKGTINLRAHAYALDFVSSHHGMKVDGAERYLADEISAAGDCNNAGGDCARFRASLRRALSGGRYRVSETVLRRDTLSDFNDGCKDFAELRALILQARASAMHDADAMPVTRRRLDIETEEFVMG